MFRGNIRREDVDSQGHLHAFELIGQQTDKSSPKVVYKVMQVESIVRGLETPQHDTGMLSSSIVSGLANIHWLEPSLIPELE